ncbi:MAG TPA: bifunctional adenosylcobinamide kinase/adenosylcobinamide-phosphate guanylyltransferase [Bryobacteraceae bacterium]|nr:bifunctional adenosylcobinamide kinase/adenosylcobinamide-phosphate guanylyltransferase [Bryobacteraceae bacterium]
MILIGGGSRSGKSAAALKMLRAAGPRRGFIATAQAWDDEMRERIASHQQERGADIVTIEEPHALAECIAREAGRFDALVVDCLTLWLSNRMLSECADLEAEYGNLLDVAVNARTEVILVTNEVGCGIVPDNALARRFRDAAGRLNQQAAERAREVHWMMFGIGLRLK